MRINSINSVQYGVRRQNLQSNVRRSEVNHLQFSSQNQPAFKGFGKLAGSTVGVGICSLIAASAIATPAAPIALITLAAIKIGGATLGGEIGDRIENKKRK